MQDKMGEKLPLSSPLLKHTHTVLLQSVRSEHKMPGEFRTSQNWIGGHSLSDATFIPPHHQHINALMSDLENFLHNPQIHVSMLIRIAIAHYQFETIHPFLDGNGPIGRLLITLFLMSEGILDKPLLYLSGYFEKNKGLYYDNLMIVREKNDMVQWLKYFLVGVEQTATLAVNTLSNILALKVRLEQDLQLKFGRRAVHSVCSMPCSRNPPLVLKPSKKYVKSAIRLLMSWWPRCARMAFCRKSPAKVVIACLFLPIMWPFLATERCA